MEFALQETLAAADVKRIRKKLKLKQRELASLMGVSVKTVEYWESRQGTAKGAAAALLCILREHPEMLEELLIPEKELPLRLICMKISCVQ